MAYKLKEKYFIMKEKTKLLKLNSKINGKETEDRELSNFKSSRKKDEK